MLVSSVIGFLFVPEIGEQIVDPALRFAGANTTEIARDLLTTFACYQWVAAATSKTCDPRRLWGWRIFTAVFAAALLITYILSRDFRPPNTQFGVDGASSMAHDWILVVFLIVAGCLIIHASISSRAPGVDLPLSLAFYALLGVALAGMGLTMGALLVADPEWLAANFNDLAGKYASLGLLALALAGLRGIREAWRRREDPPED